MAHTSLAVFALAIGMTSVGFELHADSAGQQGPAQPPAASGSAGQWFGECTPPWTGSAAAIIVDDALKDPEWSLGSRGANVKAAWQFTTARGEDVAIAHPDTGYLPHPSVLPALLGFGFDYTSRRSDAIDTADEGFLQWPGHGARTGSVIAGRRFELPNHYISGVAPAANLMPLKVAHRVVLIDQLEYDMDQLARAIRAASIGDPNFVRRKANIISMSLGGAQKSPAVEAALAVAEANNVIVLAAAGNQVPTRQVVFPARYSNVIAIAASNYNGSNWEFSSKGSAVAVAAPGQNVWTAKYRVIDEQPRYCIEPSSGTSYAVATTAGVAALWLSHHRQTLNDRPDIDLPRTFKALAACTARKIDVQDPQAYGGGILDAEKLLREPLPGRDGPAPGQSERCKIALRTVPPRPLQASR